MGRRRGDAVAAALLLAFATAYTVEALRLPGVKYAVGPGPAFLPVFLGIALGALSVVLLFGAMLRAPDGSAAPSGLDRAAAGRMAVILLGLLGYALAFEPLGYLPSTALFLALVLALVEPQRWWVVAGVSVVASVASYVVFVRWLKIPFPKGLLGL